MSDDKARMLLRDVQSDENKMTVEDLRKLIASQREPIINEPECFNLSQDETDVCEELESLLKSKLYEEYYKLTNGPKDKCADAALSVFRILYHTTGYSNVKIEELGIWPNGGRNTIPTNHYVVTACKDRYEIVVDLTAGQFTLYGLNKPIISTRSNWQSQWQRAVSNRPNLLIKMAPVNGCISGSPFNGIFSPFAYAWKTVPEGKLLKSPGWYKTT